MKPPLRSHETRETLKLEALRSPGDLIHHSLDRSEAHQALAPMDAGSKRLNEPSFLKKILLENSSGDTSELTTLAISVHAVMLESGFVLFNPVSSDDDDKFSFSKELLSVSLRYTLPELVDSVTVTVTFQSLSDKVAVYGSLSGNVRRVYLDKRRFMPVIDTLNSSSIYKDVLMFWRTVKDGLVTPLLIGLCEKSGLESPPCFMALPTELKVKILESLPGASLATMACVCREIQCMASGNDLWKQKIWEEARHLLLLVDGARGSVNWKAKFACFWVHYQKKLSTFRQHKRQTLPNIVMRRNHRSRFPRIISDSDPFGMSDGDHLHGSVGTHRGLQRLARRRFSPGGN